MTAVYVFVGLIVLGMLLSTAVYWLSQSLGSNDPFAVDLACWWIFTDLIILSKLRGWKVQSGIELVRDYPDVVLSALVAAGIVVVLLAVVLTRLDGKQFRTWDGLARRGPLGYLARSNLARSVVSLYCSLHLALFLA
jgi:hypothetical protein